jgi:hypothetical protein
VNTWTTVGSKDSIPSNPIIHPTNPNLWFMVENGIVFQTSNAGRSWSIAPVSESELPTNPQRDYFSTVAADGVTVYRHDHFSLSVSRDKGVTWETKLPTADSGFDSINGPIIVNLFADSMDAGTVYMVRGLAKIT